MMRILGLLFLLAGLFALFGERLLGTQIGEFQIGRYTAVSEARNFAPILVTMREDYAPLGVSLELSIRNGAYAAGEETALTMQVTDPDGQKNDITLPISSQTASMREDGTLYMENVLTVDPLKPGYYTFLLGDGDRNDLGVSDIVLNLKGHAGSLGFDAPRPVGYALIAVGGIMFLRPGRRRRGNRDETAKPVSGTSSIGYRRPEAEKAPKKSKSAIRWGRGED